jgi:uncharacterized protein DUF3300
MFKAEQLDQLLAPIALYPDALLAQILMAATYPLDVVKADRRLQDPAHANFQGDQLAAAIYPPSPPRHFRPQSRAIGRVPRWPP